MKKRDKRRKRMSALSNWELLWWVDLARYMFFILCDVFFLFVSRIPVTKSRDQKKRDCHTKAQTITNASTVSFSFRIWVYAQTYTHIYTRTHRHTHLYHLMSSVSTFSNFQVWIKTWKVSHIISILNLFLCKCMFDINRCANNMLYAYKKNENLETIPVLLLFKYISRKEFFKG